MEFPNHLLYDIEEWERSWVEDHVLDGKKVFSQVLLRDLETNALKNRHWNSE